MRKLVTRSGLALATVAVVIAGAAAFSAYEAHIVNVTATIENALAVDTGPMAFGMVFPQEYLLKDMNIQLSESFLATSRVDDVEYVIKQKPMVKAPCEVTSASGILGIKVAQAVPPCPEAPGNPYDTITIGEVSMPAWQYCEENVPQGAPYVYNPEDEYWKHCYIPLSNYLSKHGSNVGDKNVDAFHKAYLWDEGSYLNPVYTAGGRLSKKDGVTSDKWTIDLAVPCFQGECAQDWARFVQGKNDSVENPADFILPQSLKGKTFGTQLWVEVTGISLNDNKFSQCGTVISSEGIGSGHMTNPATYDYALDAADPTFGNSPDHKWVHLPNTSAEAVWDMGSSVSGVWVVPAIDHGPVPEESNETLVYGSTTSTGPWVLGTRIGADTNGPSNWTSDDYTAQWGFNQPYRYFKAKSTGSDVTAANAQSLFISDDDEIDTICTDLSATHP